MLKRYEVCYMRLAEDMRFTCTLRQPRLAHQPAAPGGLPDEKLKSKPAGTRNSAKAGTFRGFTLVEVVVALAIITLVFSGILTAYVQSSRSAEWAGYSLAAQAIGIQQIEQARSGVWDYSINKNELTNLNLVSWSYNATTRVGKGYTTSVLDLPVSGTNFVVVTNFVTVKTLNLTGFTNVQVQMVSVDTVWPFLSRSGSRLFTNRTASYFGPDNRDMSSL
jgi:prepilin-type N-terminal cleavage/methylation domain-containing protein